MDPTELQQQLVLNGLFPDSFVSVQGSSSSIDELDGEKLLDDRQTSLFFHFGDVAHLEWMRRKLRATFYADMHTRLHYERSHSRV